MWPPFSEEGHFGMSEEFLARSLRDDTRRSLAVFGDTARWDDRVALILSDQVIDDWRRGRHRQSAGLDLPGGGWPVVSVA